MDAMASGLIAVFAANFRSAVTMRGGSRSVRARAEQDEMAVDLSMPILVVDDYKTMIRIIRNLLKQLGFEDVDDAADGTAALPKLKDKKYGLVISDWNMEPMTGYELLKEVRADRRSRATPFIMVTAESKTENVIAAKKAGVNNYIVKPFNAETLKKQDRRRSSPTPASASYHTSSRVTASARQPASRRSFHAAGSGSCRVADFVGMNAGGDEQAIDAERRAPFRSVRTESPIASTRVSGAGRRAGARCARAPDRRSAHAACRRRAPRRPSTVEIGERAGAIDQPLPRSTTTSGLAQSMNRSRAASLVSSSR